MSQPLRIILGLAIVFAAGLWRVTDGGGASTTTIAVFVVTFLGAVVGGALWSRHKRQRAALTDRS